MDLVKEVSDKPLVKNAIGRLSCVSTAPNSLLDASHSMEKGWLKSGSFRTGVVVIAYFRASIALVLSSFQQKHPFFNRPVYGFATFP